MSTTVPQKRQRTDTNSDSKDGGPPVDTNQTDSTQRSYLWFDDGNVVLQAENILFRVHKSLLSLHSEFFSDMFSLPQPQDDVSQPMFEPGCPLIHISDSAEGVTCLLSTIFENQKKYDPRKPMPVERAVALYRLGNKYGIEHLCEDVLNRLKKEYPSTLKAWLDPSKFSEAFVQKDGILPLMANLAHEFNMLSVLPAIYADLSIHPTEDLFKMKEKYDLNPHVLQTCLIGKERLAAAHHDIVNDSLHDIHEPFDDCPSKLCDPISTMGWREASLRVDPGIRCLNDLQLGEEYAYCDDCTKVIATMYESIRQILWHRLPTYFGLPTWKKIRALEAAQKNSASN
ncbi:hypothetical protein CPC08DRAFT_709430 [Agrocybe pediades]|nr:hypothetical protein CPC08DRAFT_709430 [Agrocybe pediades]